LIDCPLTAPLLLIRFLPTPLRLPLRSHALARPNRNQKRNVIWNGFNKLID